MYCWVRDASARLRLAGGDGATNHRVWWSRSSCQEGCGAAGHATMCGVAAGKNKGASYGW